MKILVFVALLGIIGQHGATAVVHSLKYFYTASSGVPNFPEFVSLAMVDGVQTDYYDSNTKRAVPKQDWMKKVEEGDPQYWDRQAQVSAGSHQAFKANIDIVKQRFNQTGGVHIFQNMYGCEWDDETNVVKGFWQYGYDGEDFISYDLETETWNAPKQQAVITKHKWENDKADLAYRKQYLTEICPPWLKKYVEFGRSSLMRTELPSVSVFQKTPSSPVSCHATGFYPNRASLMWRKDGEELHLDVDHGEILPNNDGTFQMSADLKLSSSEDRSKYDCVFQLAGVKDDIITRLEDSSLTTTVIIIVAVAVLALAVAAIGFHMYKKKNAKRPPSPVSNPEVLEELNPQP